MICHNFFADGGSFTIIFRHQFLANNPSEDSHDAEYTPQNHVPDFFTDVDFAVSIWSLLKLSKCDISYLIMFFFLICYAGEALSVDCEKAWGRVKGFCSWYSYPYSGSVVMIVLLFCCTIDFHLSCHLFRFVNLYFPF